MAVKSLRNFIFPRVAFRRYKSTEQTKKEWKKESEKETVNIDRALKYFDEFYPSFYKEKWPSIRLGLLSPRRYCAVLNNFSNLEKNVEIMQEIGAKDVGELYNSELSRLSDKLSTNFEGKVENGNEITERKVKQVTEENDKNSKNSDNFNNFNNFTPLNENLPTTKLKGIKNITDEKDLTNNFHKTGENPFPTEILPPLTFPPYLKIYIKDTEDFSRFPPPRRCDSHFFGYYLMDPSSLIPALLLQIQPNDLILDLCSSPGGKALTLIQNVNFKKIICNDFHRIERLKVVLKSFIPNYEQNGVYLTQQNAINLEEGDFYDKILVDAPCTNDKLSTVKNNNIFDDSRREERLNLPETQFKILTSGLKAVKKNGVVVYSTCSLCPLQNEGIVRFVLTKIHQESEKKFVISDLKLAMKPWEFLFNFHDCTSGSLIIPCHPLTSGPMYFCRIRRVE